jgi:hypothetical protein
MISRKGKLFMRVESPYRNVTLARLPRAWAEQSVEVLVEGSVGQ